MKVCFVSLFSYPLFNKSSDVSFGGSEIQLYNIGNEFAKDNSIKVSFIVGDFGQNKIEFNGNVQVIRSIKVKQRKSILSKIYSIILQFYYLTKVNADVYIKRAAGPEVFFIALYSKIFFRKFVYMTAHEIDCSGEFRRDNPLAGFIYELGLKMASTVITQSNEHKKMLKEKYKINAIILKNAFHIPYEESHKKENFILWVARLDKWKRPEIIIRLAESLPGTKFILIAPTANDRSYADEIRKISSGIKNIKFIPGLPLEETNEYFKKAKIFINTSLYEGFPNTFIQASMYATPIVSFSINPDDVITKKRIGFVADGQFERMVSAVKVLLNDNDAYKEISKNSLEYAKNNHDIRIISNELIRLISK